MLDVHNQNNGLRSKEWGPSAWNYLYCWAGNAKMKPTEKEKATYASFLINFGMSLPCGQCRNNFKRNLKVARFGRAVFSSRLSIITFIYKLHTEISKEIKGKSFIMPFTLFDAIRKIESIRV